MLELRQQGQLRGQQRRDYPTCRIATNLFAALQGLAAADSRCGKITACPAQLGALHQRMNLRRRQKLILNRDSIGPEGRFNAEPCIGAQARIGAWARIGAKAHVGA
jgi:hypothetical protein